MNDFSQRLAKLSPEKLQLLERRLGNSQEIAEPIAIVGMACRFPGAPTLDAYWKVISEGVNAIGEIRPDRWNIDDLYDPTGELPGKMSVRHAGMIEDVDKFDAMFFGIAPREAARMDPQQRLLLEVAWEAFEVAGLAPEQMCGHATGVFVGIGANDYSKVYTQYENFYSCIDAHVGTGNALSIAANRLSYVFDLRGPSVAVDTACSSSTLAVHLAVQSLRNRECNAALAGGVNLILTPETTIAFSKAHMLSTDGHCRPFDAGANGYVRGEGCAMIVLKRLTDALKDGDNVLAVIRATAVNQDGRTSGITAPNARSQQAVIRAALQQARWMPDRVEYIEAHGTGTPLGDPIEMEALTRVFRRNRPEDAACYVSSVKANIGHTETVSGVAGIIKIALMMQHDVVPAQLHFQQLNPHISLEGTRLAIPDKTVPWNRHGTPRAAGASSFGFGGTNTHVLLEDATPSPTPAIERDRPLHLLSLSAKTDTALDTLARRYTTYLTEHPEASLADVCYTANAGRSHFNHRLALTAADTQELRDKLSNLHEKKKPAGVWRRQCKTASTLKVAFFFTGQGSQYVQMGRALYETQPTFRRALDECDAILRPLLPKPLLSVLYPEAGQPSLLDETVYTQPALFAVEYALATLWRSWGVEPSLVLGHSVGEYVAACVAGVFSLEDGLTLIAHRARLMQQLPRDGMMAVIFAPASQVEPALVEFSDRVSVAALNGPDNTVISGDEAAIRELLERFALDDIRTQALTVSHAFHSPLMDPMLDEFASLASEVGYASPTIPLVSNLTGAVMTSAPGADYWRRRVRSAVHFAESVEQLAPHEISVVIEIGPTSSLLGMARRCLPDAKVAWLPSLRKGQDDWASMLASLAELYTLGAKISWAGFDSDWPRRRTILPTYPFERSRHWLEPASAQRSLSAGSHGPLLHPLLGAHVPMALDTTVYEIRLSPHSPDYLVDHQVQGSPVLPAAAYVEQALASAHHAFGPEAHGLVDVEFQQAMFLPAGAARLVQQTLQPEQRGERTFEISSTSTETDDQTRWTMHACGRLQHADTLAEEAPRETIDLALLRRDGNDRRTNDEFYAGMRERGLAYGPAFQMLDGLVTNGDEAVAELRLPPSIARQVDKYHLHPVIGNALFQSMAGLVPREADGSHSPYTYMPVGVRRVRMLAPLTEKMFVHGRRTSGVAQASPEIVEGDVSLVDADGRVLVEFAGVRVQRVGRAATAESSTEVRDWLYRVAWRTMPLERTSGESTIPSATWLIFADNHGVGAALAEQARSRGAKSILVHRGETFHKVAAHNGDVPAYVVEPSIAEHYRQLLEATLRSTSAGAPVVVHLWSLDIEVPDSGDRQQSLSGTRLLGCHSALELVRCLAKLGSDKSPRLMLATRAAQAAGDEATDVATAQAPLWGLGRVAGLEHPELHCRLIDLDPTDDASAAASRLLEEFTTATDEDQVVYRNGQRHVARLEKSPETMPTASDIALTDSRAPRGKPFRLRFGKAGSFDTLRYETTGRISPAAGQVEIAVHAAGVNFSDVLKVMGLYPGITDPIVPLGIEAAGIVTAVGPGVTRFKPGDEVLGVAPYSLASHALTADYALVHKPADVDFRQASTIPITFLTAYYALVRLGQLQKGERLLIHAGAGGVGLAAIQIAQHLGAEVFATAGSDEKRDYLRSLGVEHVFSSRTLDFADEIMEVTGRQGVDVVLNSLPGEAISASLSVLRAYGRFLEIGKIDIYQNRKIGLLPFQDNLSYFAIDLDRMLRQRPEAVQSLFAEVMDHFARGVYRPLPFTEFDVDDVSGALRYMAQRKNIGKVVVSLGSQVDRPIDDTHDKNDAAATMTIRGDGIYLITGGLGALGLQVAQWLVSKGARHIALLSRSAPSPDAQKLLDALAIAGATVLPLRGDVADAASLRAALDTIPANFPPVRGVIHAAGVLDDGVLFDMSVERFDRVLAPKVDGAWNLHTATIHSPLDFFVLFSSVACVLGSPGQGNYAAGNAFLDALAAHRRFHGLPATSVNWGPWAGAGMAAKLDQNDARQGRGMLPIEPSRGLEVLEGLLTGGPANVMVADVRWTELLRMLPGRKPSILADLAAGEGEASQTNASSAADVEFRRQLSEADFDMRVAMLRDCLAGELARIMAIDVANLDLDQPLNTIGLDSLMAMELKVVLESRLGFSLPMARFFENPSIASLAVDAAKLVDVGVTHVSGSAAAARAVANGQATTANVWNPLMQLENGGAGAPVFCLHPFGGDVRCYFELARHLGEERPVYAITARGLSGVHEPHRSMDAMIADYAEAIRKIQPQGPYYLVGWSMGGIYAHALAYYLVQQGERIGALALLDTPLPSLLEDSEFDDQTRFVCDYVAFCNRLLGSKMEVSYEQLKALSPDDAFKVALDEAKRHGMVPADTSIDFMRRFVGIAQSNASIVKAYVPAVFDVPMHLFRPVETAALIELTGKTLPADLGWESQLGCRMAMHSTPGDHFSMLTGEHAGELAQGLSECMRAVKDTSALDAVSTLAAS